MTQLHLTHRRAILTDLDAIVGLLYEDELGQSREQNNADSKKLYIAAFERIEADPNL
jgi:hypothetical protein